MSYFGNHNVEVLNLVHSTYKKNGIVSVYFPQTSLPFCEN